MTRSVVAAIALLGIISASPIVRADDQADVKAVAITVVKAIAAGDRDTVKANFASTGVDLQLADSMMDLIAAAKAMHEASVAKFGDSAAAVNVVDPAKMVDQAEHSTAEITGDSAQMIGLGGTPASKEGMHLTRVGGVWKVDHMTSKPANIMIKITGPMASSMKEIAGEIAGGKYTTQSDAQTALRTKVQAAMKASGLVPSTKPAASSPPSQTPQ